MTAPLWYSIQADAYRVHGQVGVRGVLRARRSSPGFRVLILHRLGAWSMAGGARRRPVRLLVSALYNRSSCKYGVEIPFRTDVGPGLALSHRIGGVIVHPDAVIGAAVTLAPGVVVGNNRGPNTAPTIEDGVVLAVGSKVIGPVTVGEGSQVGANAVVVDDLPPKSVAVGAPARVLPQHVPWPPNHLDFTSALGEAP